MNDFFTKLPTTMQHLEDIKASLDQKLAQLRRLREIVEMEIPQLDNWSVPRDLMPWHEPVK